MNKYDRIFKENLLKVLPTILRATVGLDITDYEIIKDKIQKTVEKEADFLLKYNQNGIDNILHIEFQIENETKFINRMLVYYVLLWEKYQLPITQIAYYIGEKDCKLITKLQQPHLSFEYDLITISKIPYKHFLNADRAEAVILAVLAQFDKTETQLVVREIIQRLIDMQPQQEVELNKLIWQLRVLSRLRKIDHIVEQTEETMLPTFKIEEDGYYIAGMKKGLEQGVEKGFEKGVEKGFEKGVVIGKQQTLSEHIVAMLQKGLSISLIAEITKTTEKEIIEIRDRMKA
jgi:predicted transposase/invertase (TIGR01784 family)